MNFIPYGLQEVVERCAILFVMIMNVISYWLLWWQVVPSAGMKSRRGGEVFLVLLWCVVFLLGVEAVRAAPSCVCDTRDCDEILPSDCPGLGIVMWDPCRLVLILYQKRYMTADSWDWNQYEITLNFALENIS